MLIRNLYDYPALTRVTADDGVRHYTCPVTGAALPSVTTILAATSDRRALDEWVARVGEKKANKVKEEASSLGTLMHTHLENHIQGLPRPRGNLPIRQLSERMANKIIANGLQHVGEVWGMEVGMFIPGLFAGTTDLVGLYKGRPAIMDYKSAKKMKSPDQIEDYRCQLAAYALAHDEVYGTSMECGVVMMCSRDLAYEEFMIEGGELDRYKDMFLTRVERYVGAVKAA